MEFKLIGRSIITVLAFLMIVSASNAESGKKTDFKAQANNPLANMKALNFHNYYAGELTDSDEDSNQLWLRWAQPISMGNTKWLMRASLPYNSFPTPYPAGDDTETGIGDFNVFAAYLMDTDPGVSFGFGPQVTAPTASEDVLGSEKWSAGFANVLFNGKSKKFQYGYLLTWQHSFAGEDDRSTVNIAAMQPFGMYQLGGGIYLRSSSIWTYNFENDSYSVPIGLGMGYILKEGKTIYNFFVEPQLSIFDSGPGQPEWQVLIGLMFQFMD